MKRLTITLFCIALLSWGLPVRAAMSISEVRQNARFLSDRMAYELNLNPTQYADVYEINYDFLSAVRLVMDGVLRGNDYSVDRYYEYLDIRNEDLSYVLSRKQYLKFVDKEYFYRPVYKDRNNWRLRIYTIYANPTYFYFSIPVNFYTYNGVHSRSHYHGGYYHGRYHHAMYHGPLCRIRNHKSFADHRWHDFRIPVRPDKRPSRYEPSHPGHYDRPNHNAHSGTRPNVRPHRDERPNGHSGLHNRPNHGNRPNGNSHPSTQIRPDRNERPGSHINNRPDQNNRPNQSNRPNQNNRPEQNSRPNQGNRPNQNNRPNRQQNRPNGNSHLKVDKNRPGTGTGRPDSSTKPNRNVRPSRNGNSSGQLVRQSGSSRTVQAVYHPDKEKSGNVSSGNGIKRNQSGGSRR